MRSIWWPTCLPAGQGRPGPASDDPFVDVDEAVPIVGAPAFREAGLAAQRASLTLLKNEPAAEGGVPILTLREGTRVYLHGADAHIAADYAKITEDPDEATCAIVRIDAPYEAREGVLEQFPRPQASAWHCPRGLPASSLPRMDRVPAVVVIQLERPVVPTQIAEHAAALMGSLGASDRALPDVLFGRDKPKGKLPFDLPSSMGPFDLPSSMGPFDLPSSMKEVQAQRSGAPFGMPHPRHRFGHVLFPGRGAAASRPRGPDRLPGSAPNHVAITRATRSL